MICPNCGKEANQGAKFCVNCGINLPGEKESTGNSWSWEPTKAPQPEQPKPAAGWGEAGYSADTAYCRRCDKPIAVGQEFCAQCASINRAAPPPGQAGYAPAGYAPAGRPAAGLVRRGVTYAGFWWRFLAAFVDGFILRIWGYILYAIFGMSLSDPNVVEHPNFWKCWLVEIVSIWLYHALMESSAAQGSLGKMAVGLKVTDLNGERIGFGQATGRHFGKIISTLILLIGYLMAGFTEKKQALHDMMAGTLVLKK